MAYEILKIEECFLNFPTLSNPISRISFTRYLRILRLEDKTILLSFVLNWILANSSNILLGILYYSQF